MSKPDAASGSLENILASIRKSLSEQSVEAGTEDRAVSAEQAKDAGGRKGGLTQRLAGTASEAPSTGASKAAGDDLADLLEEPVATPLSAAKPAGAAAPAAAAAPAPAAAASKSPPDEDPLWFLTRREEPATASAGPAAEPILTPPEVVRATMPPFFGSTAEVAKPETPQSDTRDAGRQQSRPTEAASGPVVAPSVAAPAPLLQTGLGDRGAGAVKAGLQPPAVHTLPNGRGAEPGEVKGTAQGDTQYTRALEAAVLDLLKPMLAQWLDRNMPRLVGEALKEEAARARAAAESGAKKAQ